MSTTRVAASCIAYLSAEAVVEVNHQALPRDFVEVSEASVLCAIRNLQGAGILAGSSSIRDD
jgi:hypothetical protein